MSHQDQAIDQPINTAMITMLRACGFEVRYNTVSGQHLVEGTIESATAFYTLTVAGADASWRDAAPSTLTYPASLTADLAEVMGMPNFRCAPIAHIYRDAGLANIDHKAEAEQAFVIDKLVRFVITHGADWREHAQAELNRVREIYIVKKAAAAPMAQERFNEKMDALDAANPAPWAKLEKSQPQR